MLDGTPRPNRKEKHNAKVRARILKAASDMFRDKGYDGTGIDALMSDAGLTRGAFYAHFMSKDALFVEVLSQEDPLLQRLKARKGKTAQDLQEEMEEIFLDMLDAKSIRQAATMTNLVAFSHDVARGTDSARQAYETAYTAIIKEMTRGQGFKTDAMNLHGLLSGVVAAVSIARCCGTGERRDQALHEGRRLVAHAARKLRRTNDQQGLAIAAE